MIASLAKHLNAANARYVPWTGGETGSTLDAGRFPDTKGRAMNNENVALMREGYEAFAKGDLDTLREQFSPDIVWHVGGKHALTGDYKGIDEVFGYFGRLFEMTGGDLTQDVHDILANDEHGVAMTHIRASRPDGRKLDMNYVGVYHIDANHKLTEAWTLPEDTHTADEFLS